LNGVGSFQRYGANHGGMTRLPRIKSLQHLNHASVPQHTAHALHATRGRNHSMMALSQLHELYEDSPRVGSSSASTGQGIREEDSTGSRVSLMKKAWSTAALSELEEVSHREDYRRLTNQLNKLKTKMAQSKSSESGLTLKAAWSGAVLSNLLLGVIIFWNLFYAEMKRGVNTRMILREVWRRQPIGKAFRKKSAAYSHGASGIYSHYNRGGIQALRWSAPFFLFSLLIGRSNLASATTIYSVLCSCLYSSALPSLVTDIRPLYCGLNIVANLLFALTRFFRLISAFESISF